MKKTKKESIFDEISKGNENPGPGLYNPDKLRMMKCASSTTFSKAVKKNDIFDPKI